MIEIPLSGTLFLSLGDKKQSASANNCGYLKFPSSRRSEYNLLQQKSIRLKAISCSVDCRPHCERNTFQFPDELYRLDEKSNSHSIFHS